MWWIWMLIGIVGLVLLYLLAIMPRMVGRPNHELLMGWYYAHRGLHNNGTEAPENSMLAFRKAVEAGYGMELDVQLTKDRLPVIFHDDTLERICGVEGRIRDYSYEELQQFTLFKSGEQIPLLADFLKMVDGRVPLVIEIKLGERAATICSIVDELLGGYEGAYCIESFDPRILRWYKKNRPEVIRGQLSENFNRPQKKEGLIRFLIHYLLLNFIGKPDFIAYNHHHKRNLSRRLVCEFYKALSVAWTIRSQQELDAARDAFSLFIFEGFVPDAK